MMRTFFAIKIPPESLDLLGKDIVTLRTKITKGVKWVPIEQIHLTIKFIGEFNSGDIEPIADKLSKSLMNIRAFEIQTTSTGVFPSPNNPRVIWYGIQPAPQLAKISEAIEQTCIQFGYQKEKRRFSPHLTIGRIKRKASITERREIGNDISSHHSDIKVEFTVSHIYLIESKLTSNGPLYGDVFSIPLLL